MPDEVIPYSAARHPGRHRDRVSIWMLFFGLFAGPIVWAGNLMFTYAIASHACYPGDQPLAEPIHGFGFAWPLSLASYLVGLAACAVAFAAALRCWQITGSESEGHHLHHLVEVGEGRTRFLGMIGMGFSGLFFCAILFGLISLFIEPLCNL